jgi:hypothetical protein
MVNAELFKNNCLFRVKQFNRMPQRRKLTVTREIVERFLGGRKAETDEEWAKKVAQATKDLSASRKLLTCTELEEIQSFLSALRNTVLARYCNASGIDKGLYLVKTTLVPEVQKFIRSEVNTILLGELVPKLVAAYPAAVQRVAEIWGAEGAALLPPEIREQEEKKLRESFEQAKSAIVSALWGEFSELVEHITERLAPGENGKAKTFQKGTVDNLRLFIDAFENRNSFNDEKLKGIVGQAKEILAGLGDANSAAQRLRDYEGVRKATAEAFGVLKVSIDAGLKEVASRAFDFDES